MQPSRNCRTRFISRVSNGGHRRDRERNPTYHAREVILTILPVGVQHVEPLLESSSMHNLFSKMV